MNKVHPLSDPNNTLFNAITFGNTILVEHLLNNGHSIESTNFIEYTPLMIAVSDCNIEMIILLLNYKANVNYTTPTLHHSPLLISCERGNHIIVQLLLKHGANVQHTDINNETPLIVASKKHCGMKVLSKTLNDNTKYEKHATSYGYMKIIRLLLDSLDDIQSYIDIQDTDGNTALMWACHNNKYDNVKLLLEYNASTDIMNTENYTPLLKACQTGLYDIAKILIKYKANINATNKQNETPLILACIGNHAKIVKLLLYHNANYTIKTIKIENAFTIAIDTPDILQMILIHSHYYPN